MKLSYRNLLATLSLGVFSASTGFAEPLSIDNMVQVAIEKSETIKAIDLSIDAVKSEIRARDLQLTPTLTSDWHTNKDNRSKLSTSSSSSSHLWDIGLTKPFSTGTSLAAVVSNEVADYPSQNSTYTAANWTFTLSQDLWRNSFGRAVRFRRGGDQWELKSQLFDAAYRKQQFVSQIESIYWDLALAHKEEEIRQSNLERSRTLEKWIRSRVQRSAAEETDLLQAQALVRQRELDLLSTQNRLESLLTNLKQLIPDVDPTAWQLNLKSLESSRPLGQLALKPNSEPTRVPTRLDALSARYKAQQLRMQARSTDDLLKPQLKAYVTHGRNGLETQFSPAWESATGGSHTFTEVGIQFSMDLDIGLKDERRRSAQSTAESSDTTAAQLARSSQVGWQEILRQHSNLSAQLEQARSLMALHAQNNRAEQKRYEQGRATVFEVINFELNAADAELRLYQVFAALRKNESSARLFSFDEDVSL